MKRIFYFLLFVSVECFAQSKTEKVSIHIEEGVEIYVSRKDCIDKNKGIEKQLLIIELTNKNDHPILLSFKKELWYDNVCATCNTESFEHNVNQVIESNSTVSGGCNSNDKSLNVFVKMLNLKNVRQLTKYEFKDIKIEKAK